MVDESNGVCTAVLRRGVFARDYALVRVLLSTGNGESFVAFNAGSMETGRLGLGRAFVRERDGVDFFIAWRSEMHLLGDGYLMVRELALLVDRTGNEPLALWLVKQLYISAANFDAETVYRLCSYGAGVFYVVLRLEIVRGRWLVCGACAQHHLCLARG
ncbi:MAG TPA: hypothetical protein EYG11_09045 [Candidatus Latescibacteria bacterium]|nr:hypothetical protein [Candidatus Latescibacterota bacterium]